MELDRPILFLSLRCPSLRPLTILLTQSAVAARLRLMVQLQGATLIRLRLLLQLNPVMAVVQATLRAIHMLPQQHPLTRATVVLAILIPQFPLPFLPTTDLVIRTRPHRRNLPTVAVRVTIRTPQHLRLPLLTAEAHPAALDTVPLHHR